MSFATEVDLVTLPQITSLLPSLGINRGSIQIPENVVLADPDFHRSLQIEVLLGNKVFYYMLQLVQLVM